MVIAIVGSIVVIFLLVVLYGNSLFPKSSRELVQKHEKVKKYSDTKVLEWNKINDNKWSGKSKVSGKVYFIVEKCSVDNKDFYILYYGRRIVRTFVSGGEATWEAEIIVERDELM